MIRATANVSMICSTTVVNNDKSSPITRDNLVCKINYVALGNLISISICVYLIILILTHTNIKFKKKSK